MKVKEELSQLVDTVLSHPDQISQLRFKAKMKNGVRLTYVYNRSKWEKQEQQGKGSRMRLFQAVFDLLGVSASIAALVLLILAAGGAGSVVAVTGVSLFGVFLILYFLISSLYYFFPEERAVKRLFARLRELLKFLLILISYGALYLLVLPREISYILTGATAVIAVLGLFFAYLETRVSSLLALILSAVAPWLFSVASPFFLAETRLLHFMLIVFGALFYSLWALAPEFERRAIAHERDAFSLDNIFIFFGGLCYFWFFTAYLGL